MYLIPIVNVPSSVSISVVIATDFSFYISCKLSDHLDFYVGCTSVKKSFQVAKIIPQQTAQLPCMKLWYPLSTGKDVELKENVAYCYM